MGRAYNVIDADGHILEPLDLWDKYIDPKFRDRAPRIVKGENGKERLVIEEHAVGDVQRGIGRIGAVGARQGIVDDTMLAALGRIHSAAEARQIMRRPSAEIESVLGYFEEPELIHRDNLVVL